MQRCCKRYSTPSLFSPLCTRTSFVSIPPQSSSGVRMRALSGGTASAAASAGPTPCWRRPPACWPPPVSWLSGLMCGSASSSAATCSLHGGVARGRQVGAVSLPGLALPSSSCPPSSPNRALQHDRWMRGWSPQHPACAARRRRAAPAAPAPVRRRGGGPPRRPAAGAARSWLSAAQTAAPPAEEGPGSNP